MDSDDLWVMGCVWIDRMVDVMNDRDVNLALINITLILNRVTQMLEPNAHQLEMAEILVQLTDLVAPKDNQPKEAKS